ncbi:pyridoxamine 5'-phosphate oxidase family protein [Lachnoclostridium phytofermentans]|uniref:Pyridoxamine 5'-phosphate oxidase-related FMN-binding n=1 Tax=Lachnoclostridium phytofermentans (strain ATCC 700394 / DSM 18823 / ISDg) TaxID=357809 RepID=A9KMG7_LACP7|nr:pyridoxamine 5'-phosphate oxidase family protein [Lachnoclostridium phytofermentans]ABX42921.1 pyridoxamine 5'-phosphate oxidase-related FMN-binding [Lachnoclostridium phytofermentans ISDg]
MTKQIKNEINELVENAKVAYVSSVDGNGYPCIKAMLSLQHDDLFTHYFSTNVSSHRTQQFLHNSKASVYFCNENQFKGLMLVGDTQVMTDREHKAMLWREGFEVYYPEGIDTQDYCVYKFTAHKANYYHGLANQDFIMEDFENA